MEKTRTESRLGRFSYLLKGGARPRRSPVLIIALVLVALLSFAGVVSADTAWYGQPPVTNFTGVVNGDIDIQFGNTWTSTNPIDNDLATANLTLKVDPSLVDMQFALLKVVVYTANNTANWEGTETIKLDHGGTVETLANAKALSLEYFNNTAPPAGGMNCTSVTAPFITTGPGLCRVMSDYVSYFDVKDYITSQRVNVSVLTTNVSGRFDGRVKEATLIYGWNVTPKDTSYWINIGHDPSTKYVTPDYIGESYFNGVGNIDNIESVTVYTDDIASANGIYGWNGDPLTLSPTTIASNSYARVNKLTIDPLDVMAGTNTLKYDHASTSTWYKLAVAVLKIVYL